jgi:scyllo-inositol 2-dehydrogenase (NADP+)
MMGSFSKNHADVQEEQLLNGMKPTDSKYELKTLLMLVN